MAAAGLLSGLTALTLTACGGSSKSSSAASSPPAASSSPPAAAASAAPAAGGPTITIASFQFSAATVAPGATIRVVNNDAAPHTVTSTPGGQFDTRTVTKGSPGSFTAPSTPGTYSFLCTVHPSMSGTLTVQ